MLEILVIACLLTQPCPEGLGLPERPIQTKERPEQQPSGYG